MKKVSIILAALLGTATVAQAQLAAGYGFSKFVAPAEMVAGLLNVDNFNQVLAPDATIETPFEYVFADGTVATSKWGATEGKAFEIGFDFPFAGETMKYFVPSTGGAIKLGATENISAIANSYFFTNFNEAYDNTIYFGNDGGIKASTGLQIGYILMGEAPARMLIVGYKGYGLNDSDAINFGFALMENGDIVCGINGTTALTNSYSWIAGVRGSGPEDITCIGGDFDTISRTKSASSTLSSSVVDNTVLYFTYPTDVVAPDAQPTDFEVTGKTATTISGTFTPAVNADYSLVVVSEGALNAVPEAQKTYEKGDAIGNGVVVDYTKENTFKAYDLKGTTEYTFTIFASNKYGFNGPQYNTADPLVGTVATSPGKPGPLSIYDITKDSFTLDVTADEAGDQVFVVVSDITHNPGNYGVRAYHGEISDSYKTGDEIEGGGKVAYFGPATTVASLLNPIQLWQRPSPSSNCLGLTQLAPTAFMTFLQAGIRTSPFPKLTAMALWFQPIQAAMNSVVVSSKARTMLRLLQCTSIKLRLSSRSTSQHSPGAALHSHLTMLTLGRKLTSFTLSSTLKRAKKLFRCLMANHSLNPILSDLSPTT